MTKVQNHAAHTAEKTHTAVHAESRGDAMTRIMKTIYYGVWSVVGVLVAILLIVAMFSGTLLETLGSASQNPGSTEQQPPAGQPQPTQPTEEQLGCVRDEVGQERFDELQQGDVANQEENTKIQTCLQG